MSYDVIARLKITWSNDTARTWESSETHSSIAQTKEISLVGVTTSYQTIYDASQTTVPPLGNTDAGDTPFQLTIRVDAVSIIKITDDAAGITYMTLPADTWVHLPTDIFGSTENSSVIEQIDIKTSSGTLATDSAALIQHD